MCDSSSAIACRVGDAHPSHVLRKSVQFVWQLRVRSASLLGRIGLAIPSEGLEPEPCFFL